MIQQHHLDISKGNEISMLKRQLYSHVYCSSAQVDALVDALCGLFVSYIEVNLLSIDIAQGLYRHQELICTFSQVYMKAVY
jgi:hypothetical protein